MHLNIVWESMPFGKYPLTSRKLLNCNWVSPYPTSHHGYLLFLYNRKILKNSFGTSVEKTPHSMHTIQIW